MFSDSSAGPESSHSAAEGRIAPRRHREQLPRGGREESCPEAASRTVALGRQSGELPLCGRQGLALPSTKSVFLCAFAIQNPHFQAFRAQNRHFYARKAGDWHQGKRKLASGSITMAFPQITAHTSKIQIPNNQIINFYQRAR